MGSKRRIGTIIAIIGIVIVIIAVIIPKPKESIELSKDVALEIQSVSDFMDYDLQILTRLYSSGAVYDNSGVFKSEVLNHIDQWEVKEKNVDSKDLPKDDLIVYLELSTKYQIRLYKEDPSLAVISYKGDNRSYNVPTDTYDKASLLYIVKSTIIEEDIMEVLTSGTFTNRTSVNDNPVHVKSVPLKVGIYTYYIYEDKNKYYVEQPYSFIHEITKENYERAVKYQVGTHN